MDIKIRKIIGTWLALGCVLVFIQVILGGVTRLTGSGLSITKWEIVTGAFPPTSETSWQQAFDLYQKTPQYLQINQDMDLSEFKFIYFWEYFHRLWARSMGVIFILPFLFFLLKGWISKDLGWKLFVILIWGGLIGALGWIMVASGLKEKPYVAPLNLTIHLTPALCLFGYLVWLTLYVFRGERTFVNTTSTGSKTILAFSILLIFQLFLGGIVSGMKAGLAYPTWPSMNQEWIPALLFEGKKNLADFTAFDFRADWGKTVIQFLHRIVAYLVVIFAGIIFMKYRKSGLDNFTKLNIYLLPIAVILQACIGIITLLNCVGKIPVFWGVLHQAGAMLLIATTAGLIFHFRKGN